MPDSRVPAPPSSGWPLPESPFHAGERAAQSRLGRRDRTEAIGRRAIRDHLPEQHRAFCASLPFLLIGSVDTAGQPWASMLAGPPGFVASPDPARLTVAALPATADPLSRTLAAGARLGVLGLQPETRRRNRASGRVAAVTPGGFAIDVDQTFGNCPRYIQTREVEFLPAPPRDTAAAVPFAVPDAGTRALIERADTFFVASAAPAADEPTRGTDVSHRGGRPGFVGFANERTLEFPDYVGNGYFNTIGNLLLDPRAGLLFVDFDNGDLVHLAGRATVVWEGEEVRAWAGAERLLRFEIERGIRREAALPLRFAFGDVSPALDGTGTWASAHDGSAPG